MIGRFTAMVHTTEWQEFMTYLEEEEEVLTKKVRDELRNHTHTTETITRAVNGAGGALDLLDRLHLYIKRRVEAEQKLMKGA